MSTATAAWPEMSAFTWIAPTWHPFLPVSSSARLSESYQLSDWLAYQSHEQSRVGEADHRRGPRYSRLPYCRLKAALETESPRDSSWASGGGRAWRQPSGRDFATLRGTRAGGGFRQQRRDS